MKEILINIFFQIRSSASLAKQTPEEITSTPDSKFDEAVEKLKAISGANQTAVIELTKSLKKLVTPPSGSSIYGNIEEIVCTYFELEFLITHLNVENSNFQLRFYCISHDVDFSMMNRTFAEYFQSNSRRDDRMNNLRYVLSKEIGASKTESFINTLKTFIDNPISTMQEQKTIRVSFFHFFFKIKKNI